MIPPANSSLRVSFAVTAVVLAIALIPLPGNRARSILRSVRSPEPNNADREGHAGGYYVGLIDGGPDMGRDELTLRLLGKTSDWKSFHEIEATRYLRGDFLQFELKPNEDKTVFGKRFTTNDRGLRDRAYALAKPEGTFRVALLGSSMDMGWGVSTDETYENRLEDWLNAHAARRGITRRFEVINFAMAAYSPLHRLEVFRRKARDYQPDLVLYSSTMLDTRLLEIQLRNMLRDDQDPQYDFLRRALAAMDVSPADLRAEKDVIKSKIRPHLWPVIDATVGDLAARCRSEDYGLAMIVIPRVGQSDSPELRGPSIESFAAIASRHAVPLLDLSATFDNRDPATIEIAAWDDHPNALGHKLLFQALAHAIADNVTLYHTIFGVEPPTP
ncbi:MAG: hypothetical protein JWN86_2511 [Planctomycetota bacterium]|nr:hypothetical protein [Planctomycetota bacterium]